MPLVDASTPDEATATQDGTPSHAVILSTGGYTTTVQLTHTPIAVILPVSSVGEVVFRTAGPETVGIGTLGLSGPVRLPDLPSGQVLSVSVVAQ
jgi:hypothetical protein